MKMDVDCDVSETIDREETQENVTEEADESGSSDSVDSDDDEAATNPRIQQLELQVTAFLASRQLIDFRS